MKTFEQYKVDLHLHLDGSLPIAIIPKLAEISHVELHENPSNKLFSVPAGCTSLESYLTCFELPLRLLQTEEALSIAAEALIKELYQEKVNLAEIRFAPQLHKDRGLREEQIIESTLDGIQKGLRECPGMKCGLILCMMVNGSEEDNRKTVYLAEKYIHHGVIALDRAGAESMKPMSEFKALFELAQKKDIPFTVHAGECGSWENIEMAVNFGATRIGHGIAAFLSDSTMDMLVKKNIPLEICVTSNLQTRAIMEGSIHPVKKLLDAGIKVTINTDNRTVSNTNLDKEYHILQREYGFTEEDIWKVQMNGRNATFL